MEKGNDAARITAVRIRTGLDARGDRREDQVTTVAGESASGAASGAKNPWTGRFNACGVTPLAETLSPDHDRWFRRRTVAFVGGTLRGIVTPCPHAEEAEVLYADASARYTYCWECWIRSTRVPLAERPCDLCGAWPAVNWVHLDRKGWAIAFLAAACDACEMEIFLDVPRPARQGG